MGWTGSVTGLARYVVPVLNDVVTFVGLAAVALVVVLRVRTKRADRRRDRDA